MSSIFNCQATRLLADIGKFLVKNRRNAGLNEDQQKRLGEEASATTLRFALHSACKLERALSHQCLRLDTEMRKNLDPNNKTDFHMILKSLDGVRSYLHASIELLKNRGKDGKTLQSKTAGSYDLATKNARTVLFKLQKSFQRMAAIEKMMKKEKEMDGPLENSKSWFPQC